MSKLLFTKKTPRLWPFVFLVLFSIVSMSLDGYDHRLQSIRTNVAYLVSPLQMTVDYPQRLWRWLEALVSSKTGLVQENMQLRYQQTLLEAKLQHFLVLKTENSQLKALLRTTSTSNTHAIAAQILDVDIRRVRQLMVLDKGALHGVQVGQAVLDAKGIMGQVIDVGQKTCAVLLISDAKSAVPVRNHRTGEWSILMGDNRSDTLKLLHLPQTSPTQQGDLLVTSGLGGHYPEGYPIGTVLNLQHVAGDPFIQVEVTPIARLNQSQLVLILLSDHERASLINQIHARLNALKVLP
ncbi:MAG: rod shape-determining protein MreC [Gammaproteobacteria bacterium]|nr:rod shape-determining protein MreC [Gammaproteobacteria bacterium]